MNLFDFDADPPVGKIRQIEIKFQKRGKDRWKYHYEEQEYNKNDVEKFIDNIIDEHTPKRESYEKDVPETGSYYLLIMINHGYGKNHKDGATI